MNLLAVEDGAVLVVGLGYVGRRFVEQSGNAIVVGISRSEPAIDNPAAVMDLDSDAALPVCLPKRYSVLYTVPPSKLSARDLRLERLLERLGPPPQSFVYISTTGVYGDRNGARIDEDDGLRPSSDRAKRRVAAEKQLSSWAEQNNVRLCLLRTPGIYGPGRLGIQRIRKGTPILREVDANPGNRIHVDDLIRCCKAALANEEFSGACHVGDGDERSSTWFTMAVAEQCGLPTPPVVSRSEAEQSFSERRLSFLSESRRLDLQRMHKVLGVTPKYANAEAGIRASLAEESALESV